MIPAMAVCLGSCAADREAEELPNILWITNEDTGPAFGCYGDDYAVTPNIDRLAEDGYIFTRAYSNAPICAPARSTLITGMHATSLGTQHLRSEIPVPGNLKILPELLREAGYYTTNNAKTDYNFSPQNRWDENGSQAHWRNRPEGKPFFSVFNFGITHEGPTNTNDPELTESVENPHDPAGAGLPPYFPETREFKKIWAHMHDLITVFDQEVGKLVRQLKEDGEYENTVIFVFSDHGYGLPRYKRWLYNSGMHVPFVLHVPEKYGERVSNLSGKKVDRMVGFVDFAPSVLSLAGIRPPGMMEGRSFLGEESTPKQFIYGYRDRADDCYDMSRSVFDGRYIYIRNFMPQLPYIQNAVIFNKGKWSYDELFRVKSESTLPPEAKDMFEPKPVEELYDLRQDPWELNNLIAEDEHRERVKALRTKLHTWMTGHRETGLLNEGEMMVRAAQKGSVYEMTHDPELFDPEAVLEAAEMVGRVEDPGELTPYLESDDGAVRYWALVALDGFEGDVSVMKIRLKEMLGDDSYSAAILAAEILVKRFDDREALRALGEILKIDNEPVVLQAAISVRRTGTKAGPLLPLIENEVMPKYSGDVWGRYRNWFYPMFIGMALDQTLENCGKEVEIIN